jgi:hypothetical protein
VLAGCLEIVGASTSHDLMGLHGLLHEWFYCCTGNLNCFLPPYFVLAKVLVPIRTLIVVAVICSHLNEDSYLWGNGIIIIIIIIKKLHRFCTFMCSSIFSTGAHFVIGVWALKFARK